MHEKGVADMKNNIENWVLSKERLMNWGFYDLAAAYQSLHINY